MTDIGTFKEYYISFLGDRTHALNFRVNNDNTNQKIRVRFYYTENGKMAMQFSHWLRMDDIRVDLGNNSIRITNGTFDMYCRIPYDQIFGLSRQETLG